MVKELLSHGANVNAVDAERRKDFPCFWPARKGILMWLRNSSLTAQMSMRLTLNDGVFPLLMASKNAHPEVVKELISHGADVNAVAYAKNGTFPLLQASLQEGHPEVWLRSSSLTAQMSMRLTLKTETFPLLLASLQGHPDVVKELLSHGAEVNAVHDAKDGIFPLLLASHQGHDEVVKELIAHCAEVNAVNAKDGASKLLQASQEGHPEDGEGTHRSRRTGQCG